MTFALLNLTKLINAQQHCAEIYTEFH